MLPELACPDCGALIPNGAPMGVCEFCLLKVALEPEIANSSGNSPELVAGALLLPTEKPGDRIGRYLLIEQIGEGGCGIVYRAEQLESMRRQVALKVIKPGMDSKQVLARFEGERQALALMDHPNIARVFDAGGTETGRPFFVMELVEGIPITQYCDENLLGIRARLELFAQICQAIQHAHQKGIIHRDIKPSNILIADHGGKPGPKIIDFGIAKATTGQMLSDHTVFTSLNQFIGTPAYMSPEQAKLSGVDVDTRSDVYSLGVLLYELLTGKTPFGSKRLFDAGFDEVRRIIQEEDPPQPSTRIRSLSVGEQTLVAHRRKSQPPKLVGAIRDDLDWIVMKSLEKDRARRYATANGLAVDVQRYLDHEPVLARPPSQFYRFQKMVRRNQGAFAAVSIFLLALIAGLGIVTKLYFKEREATRRAVAAEQAQAQLRADAQENEGRAVTEAARARQVAVFLTEILHGVDPIVAMGRDTTLLRGVLEDAGSRMGQELRDQPEVEAQLRSMLGKLFFNLGDYHTSETNCRIELALRRRISNTNDLATAQAMEGLSRAIGSQARYAEAESLQRAAVEISTQIYGKDHTNVLNAQEGVATLLIQEGKFAEGEQILRDILKQRKKIGDPGGRAHTDLNLGWAECTVASYGEAESLFRDALRVYRAASGNQHFFDVVFALNSLSTPLTMQNKHQEAEDALKESLGVGRKIWPADHPILISTIADYGIELQRQGRFPEAEALLREALASAQRRFPKNPEVWRVEVEPLAGVLRSQHKNDECHHLLDGLPPEAKTGIQE